MDAYEWGCLMLLNLASSMDASRRTEAMSALANTQQGTSQDEQDRPQPLEPRWWYPPQWKERAEDIPPRINDQLHTPQMYATIVPTTLVFNALRITQEVVPEQALIPPMATTVVNDGWMGMQTIYLHPKKKKKKPRLKKKEDTDESSDVLSTMQD
jgi:hypothetical protein